MMFQPDRKTLGKINKLLEIVSQVLKIDRRKSFITLILSIIMVFGALTILNFNIGNSSLGIGNNSGGGHYPKATPSVDHYYWVQGCFQGSAAYTYYLWVPVILVDSPYDGSASGSSSQTMVSQFTFSSGNLVLTSSTSSYSAVDVPASNGQAEALMELTQWTVYNADTSYHNSLSSANVPCTNPYIAQQTATYSGSTASVTLLSGGSTADYNEQTNIAPLYGYNPGTGTNGYWNVVTLRNIDFSTQTGNVNTLQGGYSLKTDQQIMMSFGISISIPGSSVVGSALGEETPSFTWYGATYYNQAYQFNFDSGHYWETDNMAGTGSYPGYTFAWEY